jgi:arabinogalactan oligomer / maltooligosaccharide transport system substrate-binding protein
MKKLIALPLSLLLVLSLAACGGEATERPTGTTVDRTTVDPVTFGYDDCETPNGNDACWDNDARRFLFEPGATVTIGVDNDNMGEALVEKWNADFPALAGRLVFRNVGSANGESTGVQGFEVGQAEAADVALVITDEIIGREINLLPLHPYFEDLAQRDTLPAINDVINGRATIALTAFWDGMFFSWNETMLRALGVNVDVDSNNDGLPDAFDTWEKIFALDLAGQEYKGKQILEVFPISLDEPWSAYSSLSSQGFVIFEDGPTEPGFDSPEFLGGLEFIQAFSEQGQNLDETLTKKAASSMGWRWDAYLNDEAYPFSLVGTWQNVTVAKETTGATYRFSAMPTWEGNPLRPFSGTKAFAVNGYTPNPSAASEVLRWLYTPSTMSSMISNSSYLPALQEGAFSSPAIFDPVKAEQTNGMRFNQIVPAFALPNDPNQRVMNLYYGIGVTNEYKEVWDGTKTPAEAQAKIVELAQEWLDTNN